MNQSLSALSRISLLLAAALLVFSMYVPLWQIQLDAPQYPEGLTLKIHTDKLGGDVDIINGLNHYIGMKTLHAEDFIEFTILNYIIAFFAAFSLVAGILKNRKVLYVLFGMFVVFGVVAMADFWRWEYNYGHDLDPNAAIIVPGMAYQPPLIGFKQLLNFGAYSIPDIGGWCFIGSGLLMLIAVLQETGMLLKLKNMRTKKTGMLGIIFIFGLSACTGKKSEPIKLNKDQCEYCKMGISDIRFACELVTSKGRVYKFDDAACLSGYKNENKDKALNADFYFSDYIYPNTLQLAEKMSFVSGSSLLSPMSGNIAAFSNPDSAKAYQDKFQLAVLNWDSLNKN